MVWFCYGLIYYCFIIVLLLILMLEWIVWLLLGLIESIGYGWIFLAMFVENLFPPIPSELIMPFVWYLASQGKFNLVLAIIAWGLGTGMWTLPLYFIWSRAHKKKILWFFEKYGKYLLISASSIEKVYRLFEKYGERIVFVGRFLPLGRSLLSIPAWSIHMNFRRFAAYTIAWSMIRSAFLTLTGYFLWRNWQSAQVIFQNYGFVAYSLIILIWARFVYRYIQRQIIYQKTHQFVVDGISKTLLDSIGHKKNS